MRGVLMAQPINPIHLVTDVPALEHVSAQLEHLPFVGLDVETTLRDQRICLVQISTLDATWVVDALAVRDLSPLDRVFGAERVVKIIHNAPFERRALRQHGIELVNVFDTLVASRRLRGRKIQGGHGLAAVCRRELGYELDKTEQCSDWRRRPLRDRQIVYAALDAEVLVSLYVLFRGGGIETTLPLR